MQQIEITGDALPIVKSGIVLKEKLLSVKAANYQKRLLTTLASVTETFYLLDFNRKAQTDFLEWIYRGAVEIHNVENKDFKRWNELIIKYSDLPMDFADACLVYLAEKLSYRTVATIDHDFEIYRIRGEKSSITFFLRMFIDPFTVSHAPAQEPINDIFPMLACK